MNHLNDAEFKEKFLLKHRIYDPAEGVNSPKTKITYTRCVNHFLAFNPIHDKQALLDCSPKLIKQMLIDYIIHLRDDKKLSRSTIKGNLAAILHFIQINNDDFNLTMRNFKIHLPSNDTINNGDCDLRSKAAILLLCSGGMRMGPLHSLQIGDLTKIAFKEAILYAVQVYARTKDRYLTFCTPECYSIIEDYLNYRKRSGEELKPNSPLIREQFNKDNPFTIYE